METHGSGPDPERMRRALERAEVAFGQIAEFQSAHGDDASAYATRAEAARCREALADTGFWTEEEIARISKRVPELRGWIDPETRS